MTVFKKEMVLIANVGFVFGASVSKCHMGLFQMKRMSDLGNFFTWDRCRYPYSLVVDDMAQLVSLQVQN